MKTPSIWNRVTLYTATFALAVVSLTAASCPASLESMANEALNMNGKTDTKVTNADTIAALREALVEGAKSASATLSAENGYFGNELFKILLPPEAKPMVDSISKIPQGKKLVDDVVLRLNRSAEEAAKDVVPIFKDAITSMTITDGIAIVKGGDRAATDYLERKTRSRLHALYQPKVDAALTKPLVMKVSAKKSWNTLSTAYNKAGTFVNAAAALKGSKEPMPPVNVDLAGYATDKALDGLFLMIAQEEGKIRENPLKYSSAIIQKVFGALKKGLL
ncbi:MAG TPA: DUF4197 domain-containing protein [Treponema sp.]|nr:DUF4197 domain-containing protein [Treponema sp.]